MTNQQVVNEIIHKLGALIDELQFTYCYRPPAKTVITSEPLQEPEKADDEQPQWDDSQPFV